MIFSECHPNRSHVALGLCDPCYRRKKYHAGREEQLLRLRAYYASNRDGLRAKRKARYANGLEYTPRPRKPRIVKLPIPERPLAPPVLAQSDREWWNLKEIPRRWQMESEIAA